MRKGLVVYGCLAFVVMAIVVVRVCYPGFVLASSKNFVEVARESDMDIPEGYETDRDNTDAVADVSQDGPTANTKDDESDNFFVEQPLLAVRVDDEILGYFNAFYTAMRFAGQYNGAVLLRREKDFVLWSDGTVPDTVRLAVDACYQNPELPRGSTVTSLAMLLRSAGVGAEPITLAAQINKSDDPRKGFAGDMYILENDGLGVFHGPVFALAEQYLGDRVFDLTGCTFRDLYTFLAHGSPVWVLVNNSFDTLDANQFITLSLPDGDIAVTYRMHAVLLTGYDERFVYFNDPVIGPTRRSKQSFIDAWEQMGRQAISFYRGPTEAVPDMAAYTARTEAVVSLEDAEIYDAVFDQALEQYGSHVSVYYENLETGYRYGYNATRPYYAASVIKAPYAMYLYTLAEDRLVDLFSTYVYRIEDRWERAGVLKGMPYGTVLTKRELLNYTVRVSDNAAFRVLIKHYGYSGFVQYIAAMGGDTSRLGQLTNAEITATDAALFAKLIYHYIESPGLYASLFKADLLAAAVPLVAGDGPIAHKYGLWIGAFHDMAIVYADSPYILVVLTDKGVPEGEPDQAAYDVFRVISDAAQTVNDQIGALGY